MATYNEEVVINDNLVVDGTADETQVKVQGHSTQTAPLQAWEDSSGDALAKVTGDGRLQVGSFDAQGAMATDDSLIEAYRDKADGAKPKRGLHVAGELEDDASNAVAWSVHELTLSGASTTTGKATALSAKVSTVDADIDTAVGLEVAVDIEGAGSIDEAVGLEVLDINQGADNYAIRTGAGKVQFGDAVGIGGTPDADAMLDIQGDKPLLIPRLTTVQRDAVTPVNGALIYNTTTNRFERYGAGTWDTFQSKSILVWLGV